MKLASLAATTLFWIARPALGLPLVALDGGTCTQINHAEVTHLLSVELVDVAEVVQSGAQVAATQVVLECELDSVNVVIQVDDQLTSKLVRREVDLRRVGAEAHGRVLAIAVAELVRASWLELPPKPRSEPLPRAAAPKATRRPGFSLGVGPEIIVFGGAVLAGGSLLGRAEPLPRFPIETGISFAVASQDVARGRASLQLGSLQLGSGWVFASSKLELSGFGGARAGWIRAQGMPDDPTQTLGHALLLPWVGVVAGVDARVPLGLPFIGLRLQGGYSLLSAHGKVDDERAVEFAGAFGTACLLLGIGR